MERVSFQRAEREIDAEIGANFPRHEMVEGGQMRLVPAAGKFDSNKKILCGPTRRGPLEWITRMEVGRVP